MPGGDRGNGIPVDSYKHMECLGGMRLQFFFLLIVTLFTHAAPGTQAS